jgi:hypothetical protein
MRAWSPAATAPASSAIYPRRQPVHIEHVGSAISCRRTRSSGRRIDWASRMPPSAMRAIAGSASSLTLTFSSWAILRRRSMMSSGRDRLQVEALAAREDRRQHLLRIGRGEDELHVRRRLLERLQQRVERRRREHVHLVDDVDLELPLGGRVADRVAQVAHLSTPLLEAPSISITSRCVPSAISLQAGSLGSKSAFGPSVQLSALAKMRAVEVLPVPRGPTNR